MRFEDSDRLGDARAWLREQAADKGAKCPCCSQFTKVYRRRLNANMARLLVVMYRHCGLGWSHASTLGDGTGDLAKLRYWGLVEDSGHTPSGGIRPGWWRVTEAGEALTLGHTTVPAHALVFDSKLIELDTSRGEISIRDALGDHFNYELLMCDSAGVMPAAVGGENRG